MTKKQSQWPAWLEAPEGRPIPIRTTCVLGRASECDVVIADPKISRHHSMIQRQHDGEYWLVDMGSSNGTYLEGRKLNQAVRLKDGHRIRLGNVEYRFRLAKAARPEGSNGDATLDSTLEGTMFDVRPVHCWLLVADIIGSTHLASSLPAGELPVLTGRWLKACRKHIEAGGGRINQFMGDGYFAYWRDAEGKEQDIAKCVQALREMQACTPPAFRFVLHLAPVVFGGVAIGEEERISGSEVHFVFRMEKLAGRLSAPCLFSTPAAQRLASLVPSRDVGSHSLQGFETGFNFHAPNGA
ncbi:MAG: adenylate/guanylate cyclase domain-containing protein [Pseudomonadota bacterium]